MKILYISTLCSPNLLNDIYSSSNVKPGQAVQKFHRLLVEGFCLNKELCTINVLSALPVTTNSHSKKWWNIKEEIYNGAHFEYIPFLNFSLIKHFFIFTIAFYKVLLWCFKNRKNDNIVVCDILNYSLGWATFLACKLTNQKILVLVTDLPSIMIEESIDNKVIKKFVLTISNYILSRFDYYVILTEQMNKVVNPSLKRYLVMEGMVDETIKQDNILPYKNDKRIIIYAGGIFEKYGIKDLLESFLFLTVENLELHIYGSGDLEKDMLVYTKKDTRIKYFGVVNNAIVVAKLKEATLLVNPRPTSAEFTKYSFPSKNMEYMASGTPLVTTKLPGMPKEYNEFVYLFENETVLGMAATLNHLLSKPNDELIKFGANAKRFVIFNKTNKIQAKRILEWIS